MGEEEVYKKVSDDLGLKEDGRYEDYDGVKLEIKKTT